MTPLPREGFINQVESGQVSWLPAHPPHIPSRKISGTDMVRNW